MACEIKDPTNNPLCSDSLKDLKDNAIIMDQLVNSEEFEVPDRLGIPRKTWAGIMSGAQVGSKIYETIDAGLSNSLSGEYFSVIGFDEDSYIDLYINQDGIANLVKRYPTIEYVQEVNNVTKNQVSRQFLPSYNVKVSGVLFSICDPFNNRTWVEVSAEDGGLTDFSKILLEKKLGVSFGASNGPHIFSITDLSGVATDLTIDKNGMLADFVVDSIKKRIEERELFSVSSSYNPFLKKEFDVAVYGSSTPEYLQPFIERDFTGITVKKSAKNGATIESVAFRMGLDSQIKLNGNFSESNNVVNIDVNYSNDVRFVKTLASDIKGNRYSLNYVGNNFQCELLNNMTENYGSVPDYSEFFNIYTEGLNSSFIIFNAGKNNINRSSSESVVDHVFRKHIEINSMLSKNGARMLVLGNFSNTDYTDEKISFIEDLNSMLLDKFGNYYLDVSSILFSDKTWNDLSITKTEQDILAISKRVLPPSLSMDSGHFNDEFNSYLSVIIKERYDLLN